MSPSDSTRKAKWVGGTILLLFLAANAWAKPLSESIDYAAYDPPAEYAVVQVQGIDNEGYTSFSDQNVSLKWKADIYLPKDGPIFGLQPLNPIAIIRLHLKDIKGKFRLSGMTDWDGLSQFERETAWKIGLSGLLERGYYIKDVNEVTAYRKHPIISFLGNTLASPPIYVDRINEMALTNFTVYVPKNLKILDSYRSVLSFLLSEHTIFFAKTSHLVGIIYIDETMKLLVQVGLSLVVLLLVALLLKFYAFIPQLNLRSKDLLFVILLCWVLMVQLAQLAPNPNSVVLTMEGQVIKYGSASVQHYLRLLTGLTKSVDALIVNDLSWCTPDVFQTNRNLYLITHSAQKVYMRASLYQSTAPCVAESKQYFGKKLVELPDGEASLKQALNRHKNHYPWKALWEINRRIIFLLFMAISFLSTAFIVLWAFEIKDVLGWLLFCFGAFFYALASLFFNLTVAFIAGMPVTYHGTSSLPLTMSAKAIPLFNQAHNLRLAALLLGVLFVLLFTASIRQKVSIRVFLLPVLLLGLMLAAPLTEYSTKTFVLAFACGECGFKYEGRLDSFNVMKTYASLRGNSDLYSLIDIDELESYNRAKRLQDQKNSVGAINFYEEYLVTYPGGPHYLESLKSLAMLNNGLYQYAAAERYVLVTLENELGDGTRLELAFMLRSIYHNTDRKKESLKMLRKQADLVTDEPLKAALLTRLGSDYLAMGMQSEAQRAFRAALSIVNIRDEDVANAQAGLKRIAEAERP